MINDLWKTIKLNDTKTTKTINKNNLEKKNIFEKLFTIFNERYLTSSKFC